jgi:hypothetical protein
MFAGGYNGKFNSLKNYANRCALMLLALVVAQLSLRMIDTFRCFRVVAQHMPCERAVIYSILHV